MNLKIAILAGDGIGPEIMKQGVAVLDAVAEKCGHKFEYEEAICGAHAIDAVGDPYPESTHEVCMKADAVLFAAVGDLRFDNNPTAKIRPETGLLAMRKKLGLFANVRPVATFDCLIHKSPLKDELLRGADFVVIRELTGGMYFGEKYQDNDKAYDTDIYTRPEIERILKVAFEMAMTRRKHLTVVDKANVLASSRLWRQIAKEMEPQYPEVKTDYMFIDNASMRVLTEPRFFDVIVTENTFGDILTDETSCITGSMGLQPSSSLGEHTPLFEPVPPVSRDRWDSSPLHRWVSTHHSLNPYTAHGHRQQDRTSPIRWHRSSPPPCCSSTSDSRRKVPSCVMPSMPHSMPMSVHQRSRSKVARSTARRK